MLIVCSAEYGAAPILVSSSGSSRSATSLSKYKLEQDDLSLAVGVTGPLVLQGLLPLQPRLARATILGRGLEEVVRCARFEVFRLADVDDATLLVLKQVDAGRVGEFRAHLFRGTQKEFGLRFGKVALGRCFLFIHQRNYYHGGTEDTEESEK